MAAEKAQEELQHRALHEYPHVAAFRAWLRSACKSARPRGSAGFRSGSVFPERNVWIARFGRFADNRALTTAR